MGVVYRAQHVLLGRPAAIKVLQPELSRSQEIVGRFFTEARAATAIRHPGIVEVYDFGFSSDGSAYIVMELLEGETLGQRLSRAGALPPSNAVQMVRQIAGVLIAAHAQGIVHRDLKPDNVFLVVDPEVPGGERIKLLDFGIAKLIAEPAPEHLTRTGTLLGTPTYMAPEQCRGVAVDHRADLYSLGCILFECVCGRPPFRGEGVGDVLSAHIHVAPVPPRAIVPGLSAALERLILHLLAKSPEARPASAEQVVRALDEVARDVATGPVLRVATSPWGPTTTHTTLSGESTTPSSDEATSRSWRRPALVAAALVIPIIAIAIVASSGGQRPAAGSTSAGSAIDAAAVATEPAVPPGDPVPAATPPTPAAPAPVPAVKVAIESTPRGARVLIDDTEVGRTPLDVELPARAGERTVIVRLNGYQDARLRLVGDRSSNHEVVLKKKRTAPAPRPEPPLPDPDRGVNPYGY